MTTTEISSTLDPRVAAYASIRERDLTGGHGGRFIVEGKVTLETLLMRGRFEVESLFLCETRLAPLADLLAHVPADVPVYVAPQGVMDDVARMRDEELAIFRDMSDILWARYRTDTRWGPNRAVNRSMVWRVSAISGTRIMLCRPSSNSRWMIRR